jgi:hypothetical protein
MISTRKHSKNNGHESFTATDNGSVASVVPGGEFGDFIDETVAIWQRRSKRRLTREDGREIIENMTGFFRILQEWDRAERASKNARGGAPAKHASSVPCHDARLGSDHSDIVPTSVRQA